MNANAASFTNDFSTIVRVAKTASLSVAIEDRDGMGFEPLPNYLKSAQLDLASVGCDPDWTMGGT